MAESFQRVHVGREHVPFNHLAQLCGPATWEGKKSVTTIRGVLPRARGLRCSGPGDVLHITERARVNANTRGRENWWATGEEGGGGDQSWFTTRRNHLCSCEDCATITAAKPERRASGGGRTPRGRRPRTNADRDYSHRWAIVDCLRRTVVRCCGAVRGTGASGYALSLLLRTHARTHVHAPVLSLPRVLCMIIIIQPLLPVAAEWRCCTVLVKRPRVRALFRAMTSVTARPAWPALRKPSRTVWRTRSTDGRREEGERRLRCVCVCVCDLRAGDDAPYS